MELMEGGSLFDLIEEQIHITEPTTLRLIKPIFTAIAYCHQLGIMHRDIKPENLLLNSKNLEETTMKISDFGLAVAFDSDHLVTRAAGTLCYAAPEILKGQRYDGRCDYWSIGVVLF